MKGFLEGIFWMRGDFCGELMGKKEREGGELMRKDEERERVMKKGKGKVNKEAC